jgi:flagellar biosynthesis protein FlhB
MSDAQERTEEATEKHLKEVRSKGQLQKSRDLTAWVGLAAAAVMVPMTFASAQQAAVSQLFSVQSVMQDPTTGGALTALSTGLQSIIGTIWPMLAVVAFAIIASSAVQGGIHLKRFTTHFEHFNLVKGVGRMFGGKALWETVKVLAKAVVVGAGFYFVLQTWMPVLMQSGGLSIDGLLSSTQDGIWALLRSAIGAGLIFSGLDVFVIMRRNRKTSRMTKRQIKDEHKNAEGDPLVRAHRRSRQLAASRSRMIQAISEADVVLLNPTHVAVALKYEPGKSAPRVVAKGADLVAARIREEAKERGVPMVEDIPLARALHKACAIGQEIPFEFFTQVAQVLAFVMALKKRGASLNRIHHLPTKENA